MNPNHRLVSRSGNRWRVCSFLLLIVVLTFFPTLLFTGCKSPQAQQVVGVVSQIPTPSPAASDTIRARAAAMVKAIVLKHPALGPWAYRFSTVCFWYSNEHLPTPETLRAWFAVAEILAPDNIDQVLEGILSVYAADYRSAAVIQGVGAPYLLLLGEGIQDGIAQAATQQQVDTAIAFVVVGTQLFEDYREREIAR